MRLFFSIFIIAFVTGRNVFAQPAAVPQLKLKTFGAKPSLPVVAIMPPLLLKIDSAVVRSPLNQLPLNFYSQHLGVACKMELQMEKQMKLPIRIRLGSKEQVDYLEGKFSRNQ